MVERFDLKPIPVWLVTGFLGSGKTTFIQHLLTSTAFREQSISLILNEFGRHALDSQRIRIPHLAKFEINRGSVFCACVMADLIQALQTIAATGQTDVIVIEATGATETRDLERVFETANLAARLQVRINICLVDAIHFLPLYLNTTTVKRQLQAADVLLVNKTDLVSGAALTTISRILDEVSPRAQRFYIQHGRIDPREFKDIVHLSCHAPLFEAGSDPVRAISFDFSAPADRSQFLQAIRKTEPDLLRLKGQIHFNDQTEWTEYVYGDWRTEPVLSPSSERSYFTAIVMGRDPVQVRATFEKAFSASG